MHVPLFFLCQDVRCVKGRVDVIGLMDRLQIRSVPTVIDPAQHVRLAIALRNFAGESWSLRVKCASGAVKKFLGQGFTPRDGAQMRLVPLDGLVIDEAGPLTFEVVLGEAVLARTSIEVAYVPTSFAATA